MSETIEPTYTLAEARRELAKRECGRHGHSWSIQQTMAGPRALTCDQCGWGGKVEMGPRP